MEGREQTGRVNHALAERINQYILEQKSSIAAISKEIGYSRTSVSRYLSGKYDSCASTMEEKLAEFLAAHTGETVEAPAAAARSGKRPSQPVEMDSAAYQLNAAGTEYGWIAFG